MATEASLHGMNVPIDCSDVINDSNKRINIPLLYSKYGEGLYVIKLEAQSTYGMAIAYITKNIALAMSGLDDVLRAKTLAYENYWMPSLSSNIIAVNFVKKII